MITVRRHSFDGLDPKLRADMDAMRDGQSAYDNPFFDLDFAQIVASVRDDTQLLVAHDTAGLLGFWPVHVRPGKWARAIGCPFSDWHGPVMRAGDRSLAPQEFLHKAGLRGMTANGLQPQNLTAGCGGTISASSIAYAPAGGVAYREQMRSLHPKHFKNLRRAERMIERDFGAMDITIDDMSQEAFQWLMDTKREQYVRTGKHDVLAPTWVKGMMANLRTARHPRLRGRLSTLRLGGKIAAAEFDLLSDKVVHGWITAFDQDYAIHSPGHLLMLAVICNMEHTGQTICDVGAGNHTYKKYYESYQRPVEHAVLRTGQGLRPLAEGWRFIEQKSPHSLSNRMQAMRRRGDQIFGSELSPARRLRGLATAFKRTFQAF